MEIARLTDQRTGRLVEIATPEQDWAFLPSPLPPRASFPAGLWPLVVKAREKLAKLDGIGRTLPDPGLLLRPLQQREAMRSSSLEGTYATPEELLGYELDPREPTSDRDRANDWREVSNYDRALQIGCEQLETMPVCLRVVRTLHEVLLTGVRGRNKSPGEFRQHKVHIGSDRRYIPPPAENLDELLDAFEKHLHDQDSGGTFYVDSLVKCYVAHYQFEAIHPFVDGNGRVGRLLLALMTYKSCDLMKPWLYMSAFFEKHKDEYIDTLFQVSCDGRWGPWIEFCLRGTVEQADDAIARCDALLELKRDYYQRVTAGSARDHSLVESLFTKPMVDIPHLAKTHNVTYPTAASDVDRLVRAGILAELKDRHPKTFYAPEIFRIAYRE